MTASPEKPPAWPMGTPTDAEAALWADVWSRPPASLWERFGLVRDAATYVRTLLAFEQGGHANAALGGLVQRMADQLGLTVAGAARNRWSWPAPARNAPPTVAAIRGGASAANVRDRSSWAAGSSRDRFRRIPAGFAAATPDPDSDPTEETPV